MGFRRRIERRKIVLQRRGGRLARVFVGGFQTGRLGNLVIRDLSARRFGARSGLQAEMFDLGHRAASSANQLRQGCRRRIFRKGVRDIWVQDDDDWPTLIGNPLFDQVCRLRSLPFRGLFGGLEKMVSGPFLPGWYTRLLRKGMKISGKAWQKNQRPAMIAKRRLFRGRERYGLVSVAPGQTRARLKVQAGLPPIVGAWADSSTAKKRGCIWEYRSRRARQGVRK